MKNCSLKLFLIRNGCCLLAITSKRLEKNLANFVCVTNALLMPVPKAIMLMLAIKGRIDLLGKK